MRRTHFNAFRQHEPGLIGIGTTPAFAIAQRALLLRTEAGNILWDCISFIDDATVEIVRALGGIAGDRDLASALLFLDGRMEPRLRRRADLAACRGPALGDAARSAVAFWDGETKELAPGITLIRCGGHFAGGTVLHWAQGAGGNGALLSGDIVQVGPDKKVSFMRSYPDLIPLDAGTVQHIADVLRAVAVRSDLRRLVGPGHRDRRQAGGGVFGAPLHRRRQPAAGGRLTCPAPAAANLRCQPALPTCAANMRGQHRG